MPQDLNVSETTTFTALEDALHGDAAGKHLMAELDWLSELSASTHDAMQTGLSVETHAAAQKLSTACTAAEIILKTPPARKG